MKDSESTKSRPSPLSPLHSLLDSLRDFQKRTNNLGGNPGAMNVIEAYDYFAREGDRGRLCPMALKCQKLFSQEDYQDIKKLIERLSEDLGRVERGE